MFWKGFLHLCLGWPRKSEKTPQITVFSKVWGYNKGIGNYFKLPSLGSPHGGETLKFLSVGGPHAGKKCQKQHGEKIWNSLPWEDPTGGKNKDIPIPYMHICLVGILAHETIYIYIYIHILTCFYHRWIVVIGLYIVYIICYPGHPHMFTYIYILSYRVTHTYTHTYIHIYIL